MSVVPTPQLVSKLSAKSRKNCPRKAGAKKKKPRDGQTKKQGIKKGEADGQHGKTTRELCAKQKYAENCAGGNAEA